MNNDVSNEVWEIAKDLYDNDEIDCDVNRYGQVEDVSFDMEYDEYNEYYQDCNEADFEKAKEYLKQLLIDTKYYTDFKRYLELSDNHTFWDIEVPEGKQLNYDDDYGFVYDQALSGLSKEIGTDVYGLGRSGRHICVDDTFENLTKLNEFKVAQAEWEKWFIDAIETQLETEDDKMTESLHNGEMTADCLNCGKTIVYTKKDICNDIDGDYIECPSCHATFDVECNNDKCKVSESYEVWQKYYEDGITTTEYVQSFDTYEKAQKFADGLNEDPDCEAWVKSLKENKMTEDTKEQRLTGDETYVARNSAGYKSIGLIIDNTNKQFQIINGQVMTTDSKTKKMSKKQIRDKAQQLYDNGYTEYDGYGSVAQGVNKKEEAIDWVGDTKVNDNGTVTIDGRERTVDSIKAEIKSLRDELKRSKEAYSNKQISKHQRSYDKFRYTRQIEKLKAFLDLLNTNSTDLEEDCTQASGVDAGKVTLFDSDEKDKKEELITEDINTAQTITEKLNTGALPIVDTDMYSINDRIPESATREGLDEIVQDIAPKYLKEVIQEVLPSVEIYAEGVYHPKQYNYSGDELEFELVANKKEYEALREKVTSDANFNAFLRNKYKSYDGFISYMADDISEFETQDTWKQLVQVIMFALKDKVDLEAVNNEYLDEFLDRVHTEFGWDDEEDDLEESKKEELFDNNINASISTGDISSNIDLGGLGDLLGMTEAKILEAKNNIKYDEVDYNKANKEVNN